MKQLIKQVEQWADDKNLIEGSSPQKQMLKLMEEFGELCGGISKNKPKVIKDSIGDCFVVLTILNKQLNNSCSAEFVKNAIGDTHEDLRECEVTPEIVALLFSGRLGELSDSIGRGELKSAQLSIFKLLNLLSLFTHCLGFNLQDCVQYAYNQIKDRKGRMIDGVFVKEEDLEND